ncbi:MAG TPA: hypothetical protein VN114_11225 [Oxalicibacterium sp.]|uniref:hypothetical protein n=1 Tax=Oxalicibacterium sp. TaxID=2766525 RepID=UPI002CD23A84|nr:hypothetical protein [Oxalicibacterium sp.]HWU99076.1 hypothetical protein [Oxalicibacterium sp.]
MHNDSERTTPLGMARYAYEFLEAALAVDEKIGHRPGYEIVAPIPALYLIGHSIELSLKAYLLSNGLGLKQVRILNHDLHAALRKAKELGLLSHVKFKGEEEGAVEILNDLYSTKQLEYIVTGAKHFPLFGLIQAFAVRLFNAVSLIVGYNKQVQGDV